MWPGREVAYKGAMSSVALKSSVLCILVAAMCSACQTPTGATAVPDEAAAQNSDGVSPAPAPAYPYPQTRRDDVVETLHGVQVADPYRWLEDLDSDDTKAWVTAQNKVTFDYLGTVPEREQIRARLTELWNYERYGLPFKEGKNYFWSHNNGLQNQSVLYTAPTLKGDPRVLLDPNTLSEDGTVALSGLAVSPNGKLLAYGIQRAGSDWQEYRVRDVKTGEDREDLIEWIKFSSVSWTKDNKGFYYARYDAPKEGDALEQANYFHKLYYHKLGTPQAEDQLVYERKDKKRWGFDNQVTEDGRFLIIRVWEGTSEKNGLFYQSLKGGKGEVVELLNTFDAEYDFITNKGPVMYFRTDLDAPRGKVIAIDTRKPERDNWQVVIPESEETLRGVSAVGGKLVGKYLKDAHSQIRVYSQKGALEKQVELPGIGTAYGFGGKQKSKETFYLHTGYATPGTIYRYDIKSGKSEVFRAPKVKFNPDDYVTTQVFYPSKDGTKVPMFISHKKGVELNGQNPTYLYGYGGFNIAITPGFSVPNLQWMEMGGVLAVANLRGGGEYGAKWHEAGTKLHKQNVFDDFIAAAEYLIAQKYTSSDKLAIGGRSNGGLLVGATITQRPDLFAAALPGVGVMDMLRFHKFTIGHAWVSDYGSPENPEEFKALHAYSPVHNVKEGTEYPATMVYTADHDDRVVPGHSYKFVSALQHAHRGDNPVMIRIDVRAGHGAGKPTAKKIEEWADLWGFLVKNLGMTVG